MEDCWKNLDSAGAITYPDQTECNTATPPQFQKIGQVYSYARYFYFSKCVCENGVRSKEEEQQVLAAMEINLKHYNDFKTGADPVLMSPTAFQSIKSQGCKVIAGPAGAAGPGNLTTGNVGYSPGAGAGTNPEKGVILNSQMIGLLNELAVETNNENVKKIMNRVSEVHQNADNARTYLARGQDDIDMINTWENIAVGAEVAIELGEQWAEQRRARKAAEHNAWVTTVSHNTSFNKADIIHKAIHKKIDSLELKYLYPSYVARDPKEKAMYFSSYDKAIENYYPVNDLTDEIIVDYYVYLYPGDHYTVNMKNYPWKSQKVHFLKTWGKSYKEMLREDPRVVNPHPPFFSSFYQEYEDKYLTIDTRANYLTDQVEIYHLYNFKRLKHGILPDATLMDEYGIIPQEDVANTYIEMAEAVEAKSGPDIFGKKLKAYPLRPHMLPLYLFVISEGADQDRINALLKEKDRQLVEYWNNGLLNKRMGKKWQPAYLMVPPFPFVFFTARMLSGKKLHIDSRYDFETLDAELIRKMKDQRWGSRSVDLDDILQPDFCLTLLQAANYNKHHNYKEAITEIGHFKKRMKALYEASSLDNTAIDRFGKEKYVSLLYQEFFANVHLKNYTAAEDCLRSIEKYRGYSFYELYLKYKKEGKPDTTAFTEKYHNKRAILDLLEHWELNHGDLDEVRVFLN